MTVLLVIIVSAQIFLFDPTPVISLGFFNQSINNRNKQTTLFEILLLEKAPEKNGIQSDWDVPQCLSHSVIVGSRKYHKFSGRRQGCLPHPVEKQPAPPRKKQALPRPAPWNWQNPGGETDCRFHWWPLFIMPTNYALEKDKENIFIWLCVQIVTIFLKWRHIMFSFI